MQSTYGDGCVTEADKGQSQNIYEIRKYVFKIQKNISNHNFFWKSLLKSLSNLNKNIESTNIICDLLRENVPYG